MPVANGNDAERGRERTSAVSATIATTKRYRSRIVRLRGPAQRVKVKPNPVATRSQAKNACERRS